MEKPRLFLATVAVGQTAASWGEEGSHWVGPWALVELHSSVTAVLAENRSKLLTDFAPDMQTKSKKGCNVFCLQLEASCLQWSFLTYNCQFLLLCLQLELFFAYNFSFFTYN